MGVGGCGGVGAFRFGRGRGRGCVCICERRSGCGCGRVSVRVSACACVWLWVSAWCAGAWARACVWVWVFLVFSLQFVVYGFEFLVCSFLLKQLAGAGGEVVSRKAMEEVRELEATIKMLEEETVVTRNEEEEEEDPGGLAARPRQRRCPAPLAPSHASSGLVASCQRLQYDQEEKEEEEKEEERFSLLCGGFERRVSGNPLFGASAADTVHASVFRGFGFLHIFYVFTDPGYFSYVPLASVRHLRDCFAQGGQERWIGLADDFEWFSLRAPGIWQSIVRCLPHPRISGKSVRCPSRLLDIVFYVPLASGSHLPGVLVA